MCEKEKERMCEKEMQERQRENLAFWALAQMVWHCWWPQMIWGYDHTPHESDFFKNKNIYTTTPSQFF